MKVELLRHLELHRDVLIAEWKRLVISSLQQRLTADALISGRSSSREPGGDSNSIQINQFLSLLIPKFYDRLILFLKNESLKKESFSGELPYYTSYGSRLTLSLLVQVFASGEEALAKSLLLNGIAHHSFHPAEALTMFEEGRDAIRHIAVAYGTALCTECSRPVTEIINRLIRKSQKISKKQANEFSPQLIKLGKGEK